MLKYLKIFLSNLWKAVEAILDIKSTYQLKRNWMGDPCVPKNYSWEGLACNYPLSDFPTVLSL